MRSVRELPATLDAPWRARELVMATLIDAACTPGVIEDARLLVSELVSNAVVHTASDAVVVQIDVDEPTFRVAVRDESRRTPEVHRADPDAMTGRGMALVELLADRWAVEVDPGVDGKVVWFEMACG